MSVEVSVPTLKDLLSFILYGNPAEVLAFGISLLLASIVVERAAGIAKKVLAFTGLIITVIAILRLLGIPIVSG